MLGIPFFPGGSMQMQSFPIEIRGISRSMRPSTNNNTPTDATTARQNGEQNNIPTAISNSNSGSTPTTTNGASTATTTANTRGATVDGAFNLPDFNNPNVEFFMEVTPESITIDSLETTVVESNSAGDSELSIIFIIEDENLVTNNL